MTIPEARCSPIRLGLLPIRPLRVLTACLLLILCFGSASISANASGKPENKKAEKPYALIVGTVWGPDSLPVYGVRVQMRRAADKKPKWEAYSDHNGEFAFRVPAGRVTYVVWAELKAYKSRQSKQLKPGEPVQVQIEFDERTNIGLHLTN